MPYVITTRYPQRTVWEGPRSRVVTEPPPQRTAAATLDEARREAAAECVAAEGATARPDTWDDRFAPFERACESLPESGGTVGPLPDGTVIEVESVDWIELANRAILNDSRRFDNAAILAAFNLSHSQAPAAV